MQRGIREGRTKTVAEVRSWLDPDGGSPLPDGRAAKAVRRERSNKSQAPVDPSNKHCFYNS